MKRLMCVALLSVAGLALAFQNEPDGFRGIKWGTAPDAVQGIVKDRSETQYGGIDVYHRSTDELAMGAGRLSSIEYCFWRGEFYAVKVSFAGNADFLAVRSACEERWGAGRQPNRYMQKYYWNGALAIVQLTYSEGTGEGVLMVWSKAITDRQYDWQREQARQGAAKDF